MARSAPMDRPLRMASRAFSGPIDTSTTSPPCASLSCNPISMPHSSPGSRTTSRSREIVLSGSRPWVAFGSGTCLTVTAIFNGEPSHLLRRAAREPLGVHSSRMASAWIMPRCGDAQVNEVGCRAGRWSRYGTATYSIACRLPALYEGLVVLGCVQVHEECRVLVVDPGDPQVVQHAGSLEATGVECGGDRGCSTSAIGGAGRLRLATHPGHCRIDALCRCGCDQAPEKIWSHPWHVAGNRHDDVAG